MLRRVRPHLTYANVMVTLLAFVVLGGVAVAATTLPKGSVGTNQLKGNAVTQRKIHKNAVTQGKIRNNSVTGAKVKDGSLTGSDIVASTLGTVPYAEKAGEALNATTAQSATTAKSAATATSAATAESADTATSAQTAATAADAEELGGEPPSAYAPNRFFYVTVDPFAEVSKKLLAVPGAIRVETDPVADNEFELVVTNETSNEWLIAGPEHETALGATSSETIPAFGELTPERTALIMLQDRAEPEKAVVLQCGATIFPPRLTCFVTFSPALSP